MPIQTDRVTKFSWPYFDITPFSHSETCTFWKLPFFTRKLFLILIATIILLMLYSIPAQIIKDYSNMLCNRILENHPYGHA